MRFHVGRNFRADGARDRRTAPRTATDIVFAARSAAQADEPGSPRKAPIARILFVATALAAPLFGARTYVDATRTAPAAIVAHDAPRDAARDAAKLAAQDQEQAAPTIRQVELRPTAPPAKAERAEIDLTATGSTRSRPEEAHPTPPPAKARPTTRGVSRSAREISRSPESYR